MKSGPQLRLASLMSTTTPFLSPASAQALEFPSLLAVVAQLAASDLGRERVLALAPATDDGELRERRRRFEEAGRVASGGTAGGPLVPDFEVPLGDLLVRLTTGRPPLEGIDLVRLADLVKTSQTAAQRLAAADPPCPSLARLA